MAHPHFLSITSDFALPLSELSFSFSRSGGAGGQNVNKLNTKVTLRLDVRHSPFLSERQRSLILERLVTRISKDGVLQIVSSEYRTQGANREAAVNRLIMLLQGALRQSKPRKKTKVSKNAKERRLTSKKARSKLKQQRSKKVRSDY